MELHGHVPVLNTHGRVDGDENLNDEFWNMCVWVRRCSTGHVLYL